MTMQAFLDENDAGQVATNQGWADFTEWGWQLDLAKFPEVVHLSEYGWSQELANLADQINAGLVAVPPNDSAGSVAKGLLEILSYASGNESLIVSDGVGDISPDE